MAVEAARSEIGAGARARDDDADDEVDIRLKVVSGESRWEVVTGMGCDG